MSVVTSACQSGLLESDRWVVMEAALLRPISTFAGSVCVEGGRWALGRKGILGVLDARSTPREWQVLSPLHSPQTPRDSLRWDRSRTDESLAVLWSEASICALQFYDYFKIHRPGILKGNYYQFY